MNALHLTRHAILRMAQRGIGLDDIELVESIGTEVERGSYFLRRKDGNYALDVPRGGELEV